MTSAELFIAIQHRLRDYDEATVLSLLVALGAADEPLRSSERSLAEIYLMGLLDRDRVRRATTRLGQRGLIASRVHPKTYTEYRVSVEALHTLLAQPLPDARYLPGVSQLPIPFPARQQAESVLDTVSADASVSLPPSEDVL